MSPPRGRSGSRPTCPIGLLQLEWCASFGGPVRAALHELKYGGERRLAQPLGNALAARWQVAGRAGDLVTWVPGPPAPQARARLRPGRGARAADGGRPRAAERSLRRARRRHDRAARPGAAGAPGEPRGSLRRARPRPGGRRTAAGRSSSTTSSPRARRSRPARRRCERPGRSVCPRSPSHASAEAPSSPAPKNALLARLAVPA